VIDVGEALVAGVEWGWGGLNELKCNLGVMRCFLVHNIMLYYEVPCTLSVPNTHDELK
jgi:hypothetical protein